MKLVMHQSHILQVHQSDSFLRQDYDYYFYFCQSCSLFQDLFLEW